jgi:GDP-mannose transporter
MEYTMFDNANLMTYSFWLINGLAGFFGFYLNFASLWCISTTSATTYAIVGSLNKVPITAIGFYFFNAKMTEEGIWFVVLATLGGFLYAYSKLPKR